MQIIIWICVFFVFLDAFLTIMFLIIGGDQLSQSLQRSVLYFEVSLLFLFQNTLNGTFEPPRPSLHAILAPRQRIQGHAKEQIHHRLPLVIFYGPEFGSFWISLSKW